MDLSYAVGCVTQCATKTAPGALSLAAVSYNKLCELYTNSSSWLTCGSFRNSCFLPFTPLFLCAFLLAALIFGVRAQFKKENSKRQVGRQTGRQGVDLVAVSN